MALNPETTANVLQVYLNHIDLGNWDLLVTPEQIEEKATQRQTSPDSFEG